MSAPMPAEQLADIGRRNDISLRLAENPAYALDQAEDDRRLLFAEVERLNRVARVQSDMISEITAACMATETERDQFRKQAELLGSHLQGGAQALIDALTEADRLRDLISKVRALHREFKIYDMCGHGTHEGRTDVAVLSDGTVTCADAYMYSICRECCAPGDGQTEECVDQHDHSECWPCPTRKAVGE